ncbi:hypothetical protein AWB74_08511 [Caballeronia arvi]|uniref:Uncharacterized protein n=1 Tax=Caballeronia arvi TaxID=1777135 RepID=A0A158L4X1_9BURK|nr:hypothetical protein [Caballeronia arvi]SAL88332.1 hypothetical protein AWB74_08511 [Caballeronia arvi]
MATRPIHEYADDLSPTDESEGDVDDEDDIDVPLVVVDIFQGGVSDAFPGSLSICKVEDSTGIRRTGQLGLLGKAASLLASCSRKIIEVPLRDGTMTATVARFQRGVPFPLYRVDMAADNGFLFATLHPIDGSPQSLRRARVLMEDHDDVIRLLERVLRVFATTQL